jgi:hypothetical protein
MEDLEAIAESIAELMKNYSWILDYWWLIFALIGTIVWIWRKATSYGDLDLIDTPDKASVYSSETDGYMPEQESGPRRDKLQFKLIILMTVLSLLLLRAILG